MSSMTLIENSISFFQESLREALQAEHDDSRWKFSILFITQAIELALKERLQRRSPELVYENIKKGNRTIKLKRCFDLLKENGISVPDETKRMIEIMAVWRNDVTHFSFDFEVDEIKPVYARLLVYLHGFYENNLDLHQDDFVNEDDIEEIRKIEDYRRSFYDEVIQQIELQKIEENRIFSCPKCAYDTFIAFVDEDRCRCYYCRYESDGVSCEYCRCIPSLSELKKIYVGNYKRIDKWDYVCADCVNEDDFDVSDAF